MGIYIVAIIDVFLSNIVCIGSIGSMNKLRHRYCY